MLFSKLISYDANDNNKTKKYIEGSLLDELMKLLFKA